jgi:UDP-glucose 4-epimerase
MNLNWVIGSGGLLGSSLTNHISKISNQINFLQPQKINWVVHSEQKEGINYCFNQFITKLIDPKYDSWSIYWTAGIGTPGSPVSLLIPERFALQILLDLILKNPILKYKRGQFFLASSAGAVYNPSSIYSINESTPTCPTSLYGEEKLLHEKLIQSALAPLENISTYIGRISTIYGPNQSRVKTQGLISTICRNIIHNKATQIYTPLSTQRDYIYINDAGSFISHWLHDERLSKERHITRLIASNCSTSVATILSTFRKFLLRPKFVHKVENQAGPCHGNLRIQSSYLPPKAFTTTPLIEGISSILHHERMYFFLGSKK